jgi:hypothetical protein
MNENQLRHWYNIKCSDILDVKLITLKSILNLVISLINLCTLELVCN